MLHVHETKYKKVFIRHNRQGLLTFLSAAEICVERFQRRLKMSSAKDAELRMRNLSCFKKKKCFFWVRVKRSCVSQHSESIQEKKDIWTSQRKALSKASAHIRLRYDSPLSPRPLNDIIKAVCAFTASSARCLTVMQLMTTLKRGNQQVSRQVTLHACTYNKVWLWTSVCLWASLILRERSGSRL